MTKRKPNKVALKHIGVFKYGDKEWSFEYPRLTFEVVERLNDAIDIYQTGNLSDAKKGFKEIIKDFPECLDAYHYLAQLMDDLGQSYEAFSLVKIATAIGLSTPQF